MFSKNLNLFLVGFLTFSSVLADICPPSNVIYPCSCYDQRGLRALTCVDINQPWDIKSHFDTLSKVIPPDTVFTKVTISRTNLVEIPADSIAYWQFDEIWITENKQLSHISPDAFGRTANVTSNLHLEDNNLTNEGSDYEHDLFHLLSKFKNAFYIGLRRNKITKVPDRALMSEMPGLRNLDLDENNITSIGKSAFSGMVNSYIRVINLRRNQLTAEGISPDAFLGLNGTDNIEIQLLLNPDLKYLDEKTFKPVFEVGAEVHLHELATTCDGPYRQGGYFFCDSRADWLCESVDSYKSSLFGYCCDNSTEIWDYCAAKKRTIA